MKERLPKRTCRTVSVAQCGDAHAVLLDSKTARVGSASLQLPTRALAEAVAQEWREQAKDLDTETMLLTALAGRALHRVAAHRTAASSNILSFGRNELLCCAPSRAALLLAFWRLGGFSSTASRLPVQVYP